jgi:prepilin-type N-terminal cleavage/methylation domain
MEMKRRGFTLLEVLLAVAIFAIVLLAMNTVFFSALRLERATNRTLDERWPLNQALAVLRRDLQGAVQPQTNSTLLPRHFHRERQWRWNWFGTIGQSRVLYDHWRD